MQGEHLAALQKQIMADLVETPLMHRLGLKDGDLYGAAVAATQALHAGDFQKALKDFAYLVILDPTNGDFHAGLAEAAIGIDEFDIALQSASVVVASKPASPDGYYLSARACMGMGEIGLALEDLDEAERHAQAAGRPAILEAAQKLKVILRDMEPGPK